MAWVKIDHNGLLKEYPNLKDFLPYLDELNSESPRGKVLISTGYLEHMLKEILCAYLIEDKVVEAQFEGGNAPPTIPRRGAANWGKKPLGCRQTVLMRRTAS